MKRRDFLKTSVAMAGSGLLVTGCNRENPPAPAAIPPPAQQPASPDAAAKPAPAPKGVQVIFHGLTLLVLSPDKSTKHVDVAFINTHVNPEVHVHPHVPTLKIDKERVHQASTAIPAASDLHSAYYSLTGPIAFLPTDEPDPAAASSQRDENLEWRDEPLSDQNPADCARGNKWNNLAWVLDFKEMHRNARMPRDWRTDRTKVLGWTRLSHGFLEHDQVPADSGDRFHYTLNRVERLLKDRVRYFMPPSAPYLQIRFGEGRSARSLIIPCGAATAGTGVDVFHLPVPSMNPSPPEGPLTDYYAVYEVLLTRADLETFPTIGSRPTLTNRRKTCVGFTPKSGNCAALRMTEA